MQQKENKDIERIKKQLLFKVTTKKARERINMVRSVNPGLAQKAEFAAINLSQKTGKRVDEKQIKKILETLSKTRRTNIRR